MVKLEDVDGRWENVLLENYNNINTYSRMKKNGGFKSMGDIMEMANGLIGMVKYAAERKGSKYGIGRRGWKTMIVSKIMCRNGALASYQLECDDLEVIQTV